MTFREPVYENISRKSGVNVSSNELFFFSQLLSGDSKNDSVIRTFVFDARTNIESYKKHKNEVTRRLYLARATAQKRQSFAPDCRTVARNMKLFLRQGLFVFSFAPFHHLVIANRLSIYWNRRVAALTNVLIAIYFHKYTYAHTFLFILLALSEARSGVWRVVRFSNVFLYRRWALPGRFSTDRPKRETAENQIIGRRVM